MHNLQVHIGEKNLPPILENRHLTLSFVQVIDEATLHLERLTYLETRLHNEGVINPRELDRSHTKKITNKRVGTTPLALLGMGKSTSEQAKGGDKIKRAWSVKIVNLSLIILQNPRRGTCASSANGKKILKLSISNGCRRRQGVTISIR